MPADPTLAAAATPEAEIDRPKLRGKNCARIEIGGVRLTLSELAQVEEGHVIPLDQSIGHPVQVFIADKLVAQGQLVVMDNYYCIQVTNVATN